MKTANDFRGFGVGDIITLSDLQTQAEFNELHVDFVIKEARVYNEPNGLFAYTAYICDYPNEQEQTIMVLLRESGDAFDILVYYQDQEGDACDYEGLFNEDGQDLVERFEVDLHLSKGESRVVWDKKQAGSTFGTDTVVVDSDGNESHDIKTLAEYFTDDDTDNNPHCLIEWTGESDAGWIELWYGTEIRPEDIEIYPSNQED